MQMELRVQGKSIQDGKPSVEVLVSIKNVTGNVNITVTNGLEESDLNYKEQSYTFSLVEGQKLMQDDYLADDGIHHKKKQIVLTGEEEGWGWADATRYAIAIDNIKDGNGLCNQFAYTEYAQRIDNTFNVANGYVGFYITKITSLTAFKNYLKEQYSNKTPVVVEYELKEEVVEAYTEEQQTAYNEIKKATSYKNVTHIFSTDETSAGFEVTYKKDLETLFNNINSALVEGGI